jgi:hypothetical protein
MNTISMYEAIDGSIHKMQSAALERETILSKIKDIQDLLPALPADTGCKFSNGGGYLICNKEQVESAKNMLFKLAKEITGRDFDNIHGIVGRYLDDSGSPAYKVLYRLQCIDSQYRMWGQPYFAYNPDKGTQKPYRDEVQKKTSRN